MKTIKYQNDGVIAKVNDSDRTILDTSIANKIPHFRECGGRGRCTTCRVRILDGMDHVSARTTNEARIAEERGWDSFTRLACQTRVTGDVCVERMIETRADLSMLQVETLRSEEGREVPVAILCCDIKQFTPFVDANLAYDVFHILNRFFTEIGEPILKNDGFIYQYVGDQIIGLFGVNGAPPQENCANAVRAGLSMIEALNTLNEALEEEFGLRLDIRIGAHFGPLVVGFLGHPTSPQFSVVGDAINVTSRIEGANKELGTTFLISKALHDHLSPPIVEGVRAHMHLKGKEGLHTLIEVRKLVELDVAQIVRKTATQLFANEERVAEVFYRRLFETAPALRKMFTGNMDAQGQMFTQMLQMAVYGLSHFERIAPGLSALGKGHVKYGVTDEHYDAFTQVFLETVGEILGDAFDERVEEAWRESIERIVGAMRPREISLRILPNPVLPDYKEDTSNWEKCTMAVG